MKSHIIDCDLVSIITPAYRVENLVQETIDSVIAQTYPNWELLIADDCSTDNTAAVVKRAAKIDPRVRLIKCFVNGGPAAARNTALQQAKGRWIAFLDSDDLWLPTKLADTIGYAVSRNSVLTFTGFRRMTSDGRQIGSFIPVPDKLNYLQLLGNTAIATSTVLIDRAIAGDVKMKRVYYDDFVCWLEILKKGHLAHGLNEDLMRYRVVENSVSRNKRRSAGEVWKTYRNVEQLGYVKSVWYFSNYSFNAFKKYRSFWREFSLVR